MNENIQWNSTYKGLGDNHGLFAVQTDDDSYAMAGTTQSTDEGTHYDIWFTKADPSGEVIPEFPSWTPLLIISLSVTITAIIYRRNIRKHNRGKK